MQIGQFSIEIPIQSSCFPAIIQIHTSNFFKGKNHGVSSKFPDLGLKVDVIFVIEETPLLMDDVLIGHDFLNRYAVIDRFLETNQNLKLIRRLE